jgi:ribulose-5-phosphate 4-epimerase/fuculose-1-phosphate aldolase
VVPISAIVIRLSHSLASSIRRFPAVITPFRRLPARRPAVRLGQIGINSASPRAGRDGHARQLGHWDSHALAAARQDLSARLRATVALAPRKGVYNHLSSAPPPEVVAGRTDLFQVTPLALAFADVTPERPLPCDKGGEVLQGEDTPEAAAFFIHARLHARLPRARAAVHAGRPNPTALACRDDPPVPFAGQSSLRLRGRAVVDTGCNDQLRDAAERNRNAAVAGDADIPFLRTHGVMVLAPTIAEARDDLSCLERAAAAELTAAASGRPVKPVAPGVAARVATDFALGQPAATQMHLAGVKRRLASENADSR